MSYRPRVAPLAGDGAHHWRKTDVSLTRTTKPPLIAGARSKTGCVEPLGKPGPARLGSRRPPIGHVFHCPMAVAWRGGARAAALTSAAHAGRRPGGEVGEGADVVGGLAQHGLDLGNCRPSMAAMTSSWTWPVSGRGDDGADRGGDHLDSRRSLTTRPTCSGAESVRCQERFFHDGSVLRASAAPFETKEGGVVAGDPASSRATSSGGQYVAAEKGRCGSPDYDEPRAQSDLTNRAAPTAALNT